MINPGRLNKKIIIGINGDNFSEDTGRDEGRGFAPIRTVFASISHVRTSERFQAAAIGAEKTVTFTIRYQPDLIITEDNVIKYNNCIYDIKSVSDPLEAHEMLIITAEAV